MGSSIIFFDHEYERQDMQDRKLWLDAGPSLDARLVVLGGGVMLCPISSWHGSLNEVVIGREVVVVIGREGVA